MKILIIHGRVNNLGDRAITSCVISQIQQIFPRSEIVFESLEPEQTKKYFPEVRVVPKIIDVSKIKQTKIPYTFEYFLRNFCTLVGFALAYAYAFLYMLLPVKRSLIPVLREYKEADLIISSGGDFLAEVYGVGYRLRFYEIAFAKMLKKPVVLYAQTIGPFQKKNYSLVKKYLSKADLILARDEITSRNLHEYKVETDIRLTADSVLLLDMIDNDVVVRALYEFNVDQNTIGFALIDADYTHMSEENYQRYILGMVSIIQHSITKGYNPLFIAACPKDYRLITKVNAEKQLHLKIVNALDYTPEEVKAILSKLKVVISSRMHPIIIASSAGTPVIGINKLFKMKSFFSMIGLEQYHTSMDPLDADKVVELFDDLMKNYDEIKSRLKQKMVVLKEKSQNNIKLTKELYKNYDRN